MSASQWELTLLDGAPNVEDFAALAVGDVDGDGHEEIIIGGSSGYWWYRPDTYERGVIASDEQSGCGLAVEDLDGDGRLEVVSGNKNRIYWFKAGADLGQPWTKHVIDSSLAGGPHDMLFADVDGDGRNELVANAAYSANPGIFIYKPGAELSQPWAKHTLDTGVFSEGLRAADLDGDGRIEIVHGPYWYRQPEAGALSGAWRRAVYGKPFREMCRTALADITGNGRPDILIVESEYPDGRMSWYENRTVERPDDPWVEHPIDPGDVPFNFAHSLEARRDAANGEVRVFVAEMSAGGWDQPHNWDARVMELVTSEGGASWRAEIIDRGEGTHNAVMYDIDRDGEREVVAKIWGKKYGTARVQIWKKARTASPLRRVRHMLVDRDKPHSAIDIVAVDVDGDGAQDIVCGAWWYRSPDWTRFAIPHVSQVINACDVDGDGRQELIAIKVPAGAKDRYGFSSDLWWLKPVDPVGGIWEEHHIGSGNPEEWPHASAYAPLLPGGKAALVVGYHGAGKGHFPDLFEIPDDPTKPWPRRTLAEVAYGEEIIACDMTGNGLIDIVAGPYLLANRGDGTFEVRQLADVPKVARIRVMDVNGDGRPDIVYVVEDVNWKPDVRRAFFAPVGWLENPGGTKTPWVDHKIDKVRSPHSLDVADLDGDGELELIVGEHDPFKPYRHRCRLLAYKKAEPQGRAWKRFVLDGRFEHHDGTKTIDLGGGRLGIISHGWRDERYVHLWTVGG